MLPTSLATDGSELSRLPFAPGASPFHMKGTAYTGHVEYVEANVEGGMGAMRRGLGQRYGERTAAYFDQQFLAASWYDVFPLARAGVVCAELMGMSYRQFLAHRADIAASEQVRGVYRWFLKLVSPEAIALRIPKVIDTFFDFGTVEITGSDQKHVALVVDEIPAPFAPWYATVTQAYFERILEVTGTPLPSLSWEYEHSGRGEQVELVRLPVEIRWP